MKDLSNLTKAQLEKLYSRASALSSSICSEFIAVGRGYERPTEIIHKDDELSLRWRANARDLSEIQFEMDYRMRYHGTLHRVIHRAA